MTIVDSRLSVWEALAGRAPGRPTGPADLDLWRAVTDRLNPAKARPVLRAGIEDVELVSVRGLRYVMLRSPDPAAPSYLRLAPEEWRLAQLMDGTRTVARLVAEFAKLTTRLAPDQVTRVVADLAGNRMLQELPLDAFRPLRAVRRRPWPLRLGHGLLAAARGRRMVLADVDPVVDVVYRAGGRLLFTRAAVAVGTLLVLTGLGVFGWQWWRGTRSVFLTGDSYLTGAAVLLGLNVVALASHELGHALAARHAGRRVPAAGLLVYFGIPSVFVDTSDVWMAGRRARLLTTAAGPATGLVLAGTAQLVGLAVPALAPWTFKLGFAWYLNTLFNLNPFLALDGYYLLMDWLEIPNLRARGLAWVGSRLRRRPPSFDELDGEGRLIALYGVLAVGWLAVAANLGYRMWIDRVSGLVTGLWLAGLPGRLLLVAIVAGLAAPVGYVAAGALARLARRLRLRWHQRRAEVDAPRRLRALADSTLGGLPVATLAGLAERSRWRYPRTGELVVTAGAAQPDVLVVVDGALEARHPGDPSGTVRERVGAGGVVGLASALTGAPAALSWHTAGTTLLALPATAVAAAAGPLSGPPPAERAELEALLAELPALNTRSEEDRIGLVAQAEAISLAPGTPIGVTDPELTYVVAAGVISLVDGRVVGRGTVIGPFVDCPDTTIGVARGPVRLWSLTGVADLPPGPPAGPPGRLETGSETGSGIRAGVHPKAGYPPLAHPPGPPPDGTDEETDRHLERRLWWLLLLVLLLALLLAVTNFFPAPVYAEMPHDRVLLAADQGVTTVVVDGTRRTLEPGDRMYLAERDEVSVSDLGNARLTFRGGGITVLCGGTAVRLGTLASDVVEPVQPTGEFVLDRGMVLVDTRPDSSGFRPLLLGVTTAAADRVSNTGVARFSVTDGGSLDAPAGGVTPGNPAGGNPDAVTVAKGTVARNAELLPVTGEDLTCGYGMPLPAGPAPSRSSASPSGSPSPSASASTSGSPSALPSTSSATPSPSPRPSTRTPRPPVVTTTPPPATTPPTTAPPPSPNLPPTIAWEPAPAGTLAQRFSSGASCSGQTATTSAASVVVTDDHDAAGTLTVALSWTGAATGSTTMAYRDGRYTGTVGPFPYSGADGGGSVTVTARATDSGGNSAAVTSSLYLLPCYVIG